MLKPLFALLVICSPVCAAELSGAVDRVRDGKTLSVADQEVRLWGIAALEIRQHCRNAAGEDYPCGEYAKLALELLIGTQAVSCRIKGHDSAGRTLAQCAAGGADLGTLLVATGRVVDDPAVSAGWYAEYEDDARRRHAGVWGGPFEEPWAWRRHGDDVRGDQ